MSRAYRQRLGRRRCLGTNQDGRQHETQEEDDKCEEGAEAANGIERLGVVNGRDAQKAHSEK